MKRFKAMTDGGCEECPLNETECAKQADMIPIGCIVPHPDGDLVRFEDFKSALAVAIEEELKKFKKKASDDLIKSKSEPQKKCCTPPKV